MKRLTPKAGQSPAPWDSCNYYGNTPKFAVSYLNKRSMATRPRNKTAGPSIICRKWDRNYSWVAVCGDDMYNGTVKGMLAFWDERP